MYSHESEEKEWSKHLRIGYGVFGIGGTREEWMRHISLFREEVSVAGYWRTPMWTMVSPPIETLIYYPFGQDLSGSNDLTNRSTRVEQP